MIFVHLFDALIKLTEILSIALKSIPADLITIFISNLSIIFVYLFQLLKLLGLYIAFIPTILLEILFLKCLRWKRLLTMLIF